MGRRARGAPATCAIRLCWAVAAALLERGAGGEQGSCSAGGGECAAEEGLRWEPRTLSVVLACAQEGDFARKTVEAVSKSVPGGGGGDILADIVVVDDASKPPIADIMPKDFREKHGVKLIRHKKQKGLIVSKSDGGNAATGDIIVFFDCHVAPQPGWYSHFLRAIGGNYRRVVVPLITDLDIDTWKERRTGGGMQKCYLTWDADFKWFDSDKDEIPILSGGLLGISRRWWKETGGYDVGMQGWGGENIDQSLRIWLCGGEIRALPQARVAHMWRTPDDPRTQQNYKVDVISTMRNRARAAMGWFDEFAEKARKHYPSVEYMVRNMNMDMSAFEDVQERLRCKPFAWYLWRFRAIYEGAGILPNETIRIRHVSSGKCLTYMGPSGTHPKGADRVALQDCGNKKPKGVTWPARPPDAQRWHLANRDPATERCCSGVRAWSTDQCLALSRADGGVATKICDLSGKQGGLRLTDLSSRYAPGQLMHSSAGSDGAICLKHDGDHFQEYACEAASAAEASTAHVWELTSRQVPLETQLYRKALKERPDLFADG